MPVQVIPPRPVEEIIKEVYDGPRLPWQVSPSHFVSAEMSASAESRRIPVVDVRIAISTHKGERAFRRNTN